MEVSNVDQVFDDALDANNIRLVKRCIDQMQTLKVLHHIVYSRRYVKYVYNNYKHLSIYLYESVIHEHCRTINVWSCTDYFTHLYEWLTRDIIIESEPIRAVLYNYRMLLMHFERSGNFLTIIKYILHISNDITINELLTTAYINIYDNLDVLKYVIEVIGVSNNNMELIDIIPAKSTLFYQHKIGYKTTYNSMLDTEI